MNLVDCYVRKVLTEPKYNECNGVSWWYVEVEYVSWGAPWVTDLIFKTRAEAEAVKEGFHFLA